MVSIRVVAVAIAVVVSTATGCGGSSSTAPTTTITKPKPKPLPANAIKIHWKKSALVPASHSGQVCIVTYKTGRFCASYRLNDIPATNLKRRLRAKGWVVISVP